MHRIEQTLTELQARLVKAAKKAERPADACRLLGVSKRQPVEKIREAFAAGLREFGENYLQEALAKQTELSDLDICWHFIGPIQSNKTRDIANNFRWVHSVDRLKIAQRLSSQCESDQELNVCVQVNIDGEDSKSGVSVAELPKLVADIAQLPKLQLRGLMIIPRPREAKEELAIVFRKTRHLLEQLNDEFSLSMDTLSMGMSADADIAIAEGATIVRIGTALFGERPA